MRPRHISVAIALIVLAAAPLGAQQNRCAQCHYANLLDVPAWARLSDWEQSAHARHGVTCERCHGGDPASFVPADAHRGVIGSRSPESPVARGNLPVTCGGCHPAAASAFGKSRHLALLREGNANAPSCSNCHGAMTARRPSAEALERTCAGCHGPESSGAAHPPRARAALEQIADLRTRLDRVAASIPKVTLPMERQRLAAEQRLIAGGLTSAVDALHAYDLEGVLLKLATIRERTTALEDEMKTAGG